MLTEWHGVAAVDTFLAMRPTTDYFERIREFDAPADAVATGTAASQ